MKGNQRNCSGLQGSKFKEVHVNDMNGVNVTNKTGGIISIVQKYHILGNTEPALY